MELAGSHWRQIVFKVQFRQIDKQRAPKFGAVVKLEVFDRDRRSQQSHFEFSDAHLESGFGSNPPLRQRFYQRILKQHERYQQHDQKQKAPKDPANEKSHDNLETGLAIWALRIKCLR